MSEVQELRSEMTAEPQVQDDGLCIQAGGYFLELSLDWIVLRASENIHGLLGESHVTLIDEPLGRFVHSQALHDLRNLFSRLSGTLGIARAYRVRLTDEPDLVDIAFQLSDGRVVLEAVPSSDDAFGTAFGTVGGLIAGLANANGQALLDAGARRMRALTGYDRVILECDGERAESSRAAASGSADSARDVPVILADLAGENVPVFPRRSKDTSIGAALMRSADRQAIEQLRDKSVRSTLRVPLAGEGVSGEFRCESPTARPASFELHAAAELFAQLFAMRVEMDRLKRK